ncbi:dTDP-4-dehydrorhamnose 3,5-epimerase [Alteromonas portus]|uniref:dTDP-4-dehydrorhamnose 3,5-epimerase n=1 Tax=Alteromonas portus TaxID=2565549 RepID=UPI00196A4E55|nr:dTDP-4-dehydrorhamnose 3,5-epimerase [Alteromonas portus]
MGAKIKELGYQELNHPLKEWVFISSEKIIDNEKGNIRHIVKASSTAFTTFGEAYFTEINFNERKGWKKHLKMTLNLITCYGEVLFYFVHPQSGEIFKIMISSKNNIRLTVRPGIWFCFEGVGISSNLVLNIASIAHDPSESENRPLDFYFGEQE